MDPYAPPHARVGEPGQRDAKDLRKPIRPAQRRPFLVWITQILAALVIAGELYRFFVVVRDGADGAPIGTFALKLSLLAVCSIVPLGILSYGLARARRWSWHGSIVFAVVWLILVALQAFFTPQHQPHFAGPTRRAVVVGLHAIYLIALFISPKMRRFLGVHRPKAG